VFFVVLCVLSVPKLFSIQDRSPVKNPVNKKFLFKIRNQSYIWVEASRTTSSLTENFKKMKSKPFTWRWMLPLLLTGCFSVMLIAWGQKQTTPSPQKTYTDTTPKKKTDKKVQDLDDVLDQMDKVDIQKTMEKAMKEMQEAMKSLDVQKMQLDAQKALREIDMEKVKGEMDKAMQQLKEVDLVKMKQELDASLAKIDMTKLKAEMEQFQKVDMKAAEEEMKKAKEEMERLGPQMKDEMEKVKAEMEKIGPQIKEEMEKAKVDIEKAKTEIKEYKNFVDGLEKDGLINKKEEYSIQHKNGELIINGKTQPESIYNKYRGFLDNHKKFTIKKSADDFNIDLDHD
jgi:hypothetical protein